MNPRRPDRVLAAALDCAGICRAELMSRQRGKLTPKKQAVTAAVRLLAYPPPSYPELAAMCGRRFHSSVWYRVRAFGRLPAGVRRIWLAKVMRRLEDRA